MLTGGKLSVQDSTGVCLWQLRRGSGEWPSGQQYSQDEPGIYWQLLGGVQARFSIVGGPGIAAASWAIARAARTDPANSILFGFENNIVVG